MHVDWVWQTSAHLKTAFNPNLAQASPGRSVSLRHKPHLKTAFNSNSAHASPGKSVSLQHKPHLKAQSTQTRHKPHLVSWKTSGPSCVAWSCACDTIPAAAAFTLDTGNCCSVGWATEGTAGSRLGPG
eukprot:scaffold226801_cov20-Tisochrysis_lutea.AAC.5